MSLHQELFKIGTKTRLLGVELQSLNNSKMMPWETVSGPMESSAEDGPARSRNLIEL